MSSQDDLEQNSDKPEIRLAGLRIVVHGFQFPKASDKDEADWLVITARCSAPGASVWLTEPCLRLFELKHFRDLTHKLYKTLSGKAVLECLEPYLAIVVESKGSNGHFAVKVSITPDQFTQKHVFEFEIDQSYFPDFLRDCDKVLEVLQGPKSSIFKNIFKRLS